MHHNHNHTYAPAEEVNDDGEPPCCRFYYSPLSMNCIEVQILLKEGNVAHELVDVDITKGQNRTAEFRALNPLMQIPVLEDEDGTVVFESNAILRYICNTFSLDDHFYPTSNRERARLEMALDWRQTNLYPHIAKAAYPALGFSKDFNSVKQGMAEVDKDLRMLSGFWLKDRPFICGDKPSIADLAIACPLLMLEATNVEVPSAVQTYIARVASTFESWDYMLTPFFNYLDSLR